jgi:hypothetical protein
MTVRLATIAAMAALAALLLLGAVLVATLPALAHPPANPEAYWIARQLYKRVDNDRYLVAYNHVGADAKRIMGHAAQDSCQGRLYEDFSCSGRRT